ncbi:hypothetical protein [Alkalimarinus sediminis]|uniref:Uncharacterized protein n=1 Tax=Alkalimarinus sediminis TaxID=1632866 RepID=A0A9E8HIS2_9ALTE|nr:hypothetical protein [Alkalimarinus sediminis]UZW75130.1 hypothetical protein NNL22_00545 [Alkalimarinus sediminis]
MITYAYWALVIGLSLLVLFLLGVKRDSWKAAAITSLVIMVIGWAAYFFHFQQVFVKNWGGVMTLTIPKGQLHMGATWKDDNLWIENYDPQTNTCHFREYSKGALLEGKVVIKDCNPLMPK